MVQIRQYLNRKGQGIVEYAVLLALIVGIAVFLNDGSIGEGVQGSFDNIVALFKGEDVQGQGQSGYVAWNKRGKNQLHNYETGEDLVPDAERVAADQAALINIAEFFMGKTRATVKSVISGQDGNNSDGVVLLDYKDWTEEGSYTDGNIKTGLSDYTQYNSTPTDRTNQRIYNWMQGDYGTVVGNTIDDSSYHSEYNYDPNNRYLVSNAMINPNSATPNSNAKWIDNRTVRVALTYEGSGNSATVKEARVYVTRGERTQPNSGYRELDVTTTYDNSGAVTWKQTTEGSGYYKFK